MAVEIRAATYAALRTALAAGTYQAGQMVFCEGRAAAGDGGQGMGQVEYNVGGEFVDDNFDSITSADGTWRWSRISGGYFEVAGVLRPGADGTWTILDDSGHTPKNVASVTQDGDDIIVTYSKTAQEVVTFTVVPDEVLALDFNCGASVGLSSLSIKLHSVGACGGYISYNGTTWNISSTYLVSSVSWNSGELLINVPAYVGGLRASINVRDGAYIGSFGESSFGQLRARFYDYSGTWVTTQASDMAFRFCAGPEKAVNPANVKTDFFANGNLFFRGLFRA